MTTSSSELQNPDFRLNRGLFIAAGFAALLILGGSFLDFGVGAATGADLTSLPQTAVERFAELGASPLLGLYHLDLLNALTQLLMLPVFLGFGAAHLGRGRSWARLALGLYLIATALFLAGNAALPMLELAGKYAAAGSEGQRAALAAAGEALLARGAHGSLGAFAPFGLATLATLSMSAALLAGGIFSKLAAWAGLVGNALLLLYLVLVSFVPSTQSLAMALAAPGGLLAMLWLLLVALRFFRLGREAKSN